MSSLLVDMLFSYVYIFVIENSIKKPLIIIHSFQYSTTFPLICGGFQGASETCNLQRKTNILWGVVLKHYIYYLPAKHHSPSYWYSKKEKKAWVSSRDSTVFSEDNQHTSSSSSLSCLLLETATSVATFYC